jgi:ABC-type phosphate/phosphonate transport system permease subunit
MFLVLFGLGVFGGLAVIPYSFALNRNNLAQAKLSQPVLVLIAFAQTAVLMAVAVGVGLLAAKPVGLDASYIPGGARQERSQERL